MLHSEGRVRVLLVKVWGWDDGVGQVEIGFGSRQGSAWGESKMGNGRIRFADLFFFC